MSNSNNLFVKFKNMPVDSIIKTVIVATILCFVCSMVVSFAAVNLKEIQDVNKTLDKQKIYYKLQVYIMMGWMYKKLFLHFSLLL